MLKVLETCGLPVSLTLMLERPAGFEPATSALEARSSTPELRTRIGAGSGNRTRITGLADRRTTTVLCSRLEVCAGFEPAPQGFAVPCITILLAHHCWWAPLVSIQALRFFGPALSPDQLEALAPVTGFEPVAS